MVEVLLQTFSQIIGHMINIENSLYKEDKIQYFVMLPIYKLVENMEKKNLTSIANI